MALKNLRIIFVSVQDSTHIIARFSESLNEQITTSNIVISPQTPGIPTPSVLLVSISNDTITIFTQPLTENGAYFISFISTNSVSFSSLNGDAIILNDGTTNKQLIIGPVASDNPVRKYLTDYFRNNVYDLEDPSVISKYIQILSNVLSQSLYAIRQSGNENYLSFSVKDEMKIRGSGPTDRLTQESAYEILRVGLTPTRTGSQTTVNVSSFPNYIVSLLSTNNIDSIIVDSNNALGTFDPTSLIINCTKQPVIIANSITFIYNSILAPFEYNITDLGYQLNNSNYDPNFASTFLTLNTNQIKLNENVLNNPNFSLDNIAQIQVNYQFKNLGKVIDPTSLTIDAVLSSTREVLPPLENVFILQHAPIVESNDNPGKVGDVIFIDPNALSGSNTPHPAFTNEIQFSFEYLPARPGEYSVDYNLGNVYVFGQDKGRTGTGAFPPLATYFYRLVFKSEVDYVYDSDTSDLVALPNGNLLNSSANINFSFEQVLIPGIDYNADAHLESLNESIDNRLIALNAIQPLNSPITDVFRIFNQTTGEIYKTLRWTDTKIFFNYNIPPNIQNQVQERASFQLITNEVLIVNSITQITPSINQYKIFLANNNIIASTEDGIGYSANSSVSFTNNNLFIQEHYFDNNLTESINNSHLQNIGDYQIDYVNGIIWVFVPNSQTLDIGYVSYKRGYIAPQFPHIITVSDLYYKIDLLQNKNKSFNYTSFQDGSILPSNFDVENEVAASNNISFPYQLFNQQVGAFINASFVPGVNNDIKYIRKLFEYDDLVNNIFPINFATSSSFTGKIITVQPLTFNEYHTVNFDGTHYYINLNTNLVFLSPNITLTVSITRLSDNAQLWNNSGQIILGSPLRLNLPGINSTAVNNSVLVSYSFIINNLSRIVVDYNKGDYFIDYSYLADEILISYEYGDNVIDFRQSNTLSPGDQYFVSYKVGALRNALLKNFGTLIDIPILNNLNVDFERERYRDALMAALQSFTTGPTVSSMKNIVNTIVHTPPNIIESAFQNWTLGNTLLNLEPIKTTGTFNLIPAKYDLGVPVEEPGQSITFPVSSNLRLEQGSLEFWTIPNWNGLDNQSNLTFKITKNGIPVQQEFIFIGAGEVHPPLLSPNNTFTVNNLNSIIGVPNGNKDGIFIYLAPDASGLFDRWYVNVIDGYDDGYSVKNFKINISTDGRFYDLTSNTDGYTSSIFSGTNSIQWNIESANINTSINFIADYQHYFFDFGEEANLNRFSIFKDESGYLNFKIVDKFNKNYIVDADISNWVSGQLHHIAVAWKINNSLFKDEMHLFIDGQEVPNIIKYGNKLTPYLHEKYRTIDPETIIGAITKNIVSSTDLITTSGSNQVSSSINFSASGINPGDILYIEAAGFAINGYSIANVNGQILTLTSTLNITASNLTYSVNKTSFPVQTEIDLYNNIKVSLLHSLVNGNDLQITINNNVVSSASTDFTSLGIVPGNLLQIAESGFSNLYTITTVNGHNLILFDLMPESFNNAQFYVFNQHDQEIPGVRALNPAYDISKDANNNNILTILGLAKINDIILLETLGINHQRIRQPYYVWGNSSNILKTNIPTPATLADVNIFHILLNNLDIGPNNSTLIGGIFHSNNITTDQPSTSNNGRTLSVYISGDNIDYSSPVIVNINGTINGVANLTTTLTFTTNTIENTSSQISLINYINVVCKPINPNINCLNIKIQEFNPITVAENSTLVPITRFSYQILAGNSLSGIGGTNTVSDNINLFSSADINNYLIISSPPSVAGQYVITEVSEDLSSITLNTNLASSFSNGIYQILNTTNKSSGFQNGYFTFENSSTPGVPYNLVQGLYLLDYYTFLSIPFEVDNLYGYIGTDFQGKNTVNAIIDEFNIVSNTLTDIRIGEIPTTTESITQDFNSLKALQPNSNTLMLCHFDQIPFINSANIYTTSTNQFIQSSNNVNSNFGKSILFTKTPLLIDNTGIVNYKKEGTIEFWISPLLDTFYDKNFRYYFDANGMTTEQVISLNNTTLKTAGKVSKVLSVKTLEKDKDYFAGGSISPIDQQTIFLNNALPNQQTKVVITYLPVGLIGDRISIFKDQFGYLNFEIFANNIDHILRAPMLWRRGEWHRVRAQYQINQGIGIDQMRLFVDGYEQGNMLLGNGMLFGQGEVFGSTFFGHNNIQNTITFSDPINEFTIGSDFTQQYGAFASIDNLRISSIFRPIFMPFDESLDPNYSSNFNVVFPVTPDLYTTLLLDFNSLLTKTTSFAMLKNKRTGLFDITVQVFDSFDIVKDNQKVQDILETLINTLKPANSRVFIQYFQ